MRLGIAIVISLALAVWLLIGTHLDVLGTAVTRLSANVVLISVGGLAASYFFRAMRIYDEFRRDARCRFGACLRIALIHNAMVNIVPFRGGELAFPLLVRSTFGTALPRAVTSLLWFRLQDVLVVCIVAAVAWPGLPLSARIASAMALTAIAWSVPRCARAARERVKKNQSTTRLIQLGMAFADSTRDALQGWFWTLANWSVKVAAQACLFSALLGSDPSHGVTGTLGAELSAILPVQGVAGFGTYEAGAAATLLATGIHFEDGIRAAFVVHLFVVTCALLAGAIAYLSPSGGPTASASQDLLKHEQQQPAPSR